MKDYNISVQPHPARRVGSQGGSLRRSWALSAAPLPRDPRLPARLLRPSAGLAANLSPGLCCHLLVLLRSATSCTCCGLPTTLAAKRLTAGQESTLRSLTGITQPTVTIFRTFQLACLHSPKLSWFDDDGGHQLQQPQRAARVLARAW